ncbi:Chromatin modification-related protein [Lachnellula suecica]|uniref:Chromatin modification-related protein n=1 Tax=Lachnellula suecica TaxID=602035 RepID=A0A8T9C1P4_9HELO|nr:Chromatin modification-related protein [Lachnellula suecica]
MPRDDLSIDVNTKYRAMPPQVELQDAAATLEEWINRVANLPNEVTYMQQEIEEKDKLVQQCLRIIKKNDENIQNFIVANTSAVQNPKEEQLRKTILENYDKAEVLNAEKIALAAKLQLMIDKHVLALDKHIKILQDKGEFPNDPDLPSLLRPEPQNVVSAPRPVPSVAQMPSNATAHPAAAPHQRHPNQYSQNRTPSVAQARQSNGPATHSSAPATPAAAMLQNRQARESSLGAQKRQRGPTGLGPLPPSGLARHSSMTPGTPRAGTPSGRAGSAGPRSTQKTGAHKKVAPTGSRQSGVPRKSKPGKSGLSRLKRAGNKNSPSSANDSELSEAESGTGDEDDEAVTPSAGRGDGDEDMLDIDEEEGSDDKKYCTCQSVSYGDMVACDNDNCPFEWFHWSCVGLKSEPVGTWICPVCTKHKNRVWDSLEDSFEAWEDLHISMVFRITWVGKE